MIYVGKEGEDCNSNGLTSVEESCLRRWIEVEFTLQLGPAAVVEAAILIELEDHGIYVHKSGSKPPLVFISEEVIKETVMRSNFPIPYSRE